MNYLLLLTLLATASPVIAVAAAQAVDITTLDGKVLLGYQGCTCLMKTPNRPRRCR